MLLNLVAAIKLIYCISLIYFLLRNLNFSLFLYRDFCFKCLFALNFFLLLFKNKQFSRKLFRFFFVLYISLTEVVVVFSLTEYYISLDFLYLLSGQTYTAQLLFDFIKNFSFDSNIAFQRFLAFVYNLIYLLFLRQFCNIV